MWDTDKRYNQGGLHKDSEERTLWEVSPEGWEEVGAELGFAGREPGKYWEGKFLKKS